MVLDGLHPDLFTHSERKTFRRVCGSYIFVGYVLNEYWKPGWIGEKGYCERLCIFWVCAHEAQCLEPCTECKQCYAVVCLVSHIFYRNQRFPAMHVSRRRVLKPLSALDPVNLIYERIHKGRAEADIVCWF